MNTESSVDSTTAPRNTALITDAMKRAIFEVIARQLHRARYRDGFHADVVPAVLFFDVDHLQCCKCGSAV